MFESTPPLTAVRAFEAAARRGSFAAAASDLKVTHWAIGKQVRSLEEWLGQALFERRGRELILTDAGRELSGEAHASLSRLTEVTNALRRRELVQRVSGAVRINVLSSFALHWLIPRLASFRSQYPDVEVQVSTTSRRYRYLPGAFDLGVVLSPIKGLKAELLFPDLRRPACNPEILRIYPISSVEDLRRHTLLHSASTRNAWAEWLVLAGAAPLTPVRHMEFEHVYLQIKAAMDALGVALLSLPLIEDELASGRLVCPIAAPDWQQESYFLVGEQREDRPAVQAFRSWLLLAARVHSRSAKPASPSHA